MRAATPGTTVAVLPMPPATAAAALSGAISANQDDGRALYVAIGHSDGACSAFRLHGSGAEASPADLNVSMMSVPRPGLALSESGAREVKSVDLATLSNTGYMSGGTIMTAELRDGAQYHALLVGAHQVLSSNWVRVALHQPVPSTIQQMCIPAALSQAAIAAIAPHSMLSLASGLHEVTAVSSAFPCKFSLATQSEHAHDGKHQIESLKSAARDISLSSSSVVQPGGSFKRFDDSLQTTDHWPVLKACGTIGSLASSGHSEGGAFISRGGGFADTIRGNFGAQIAPLAPPALLSPSSIPRDTQRNMTQDGRLLMSSFFLADSSSCQELEAGAVSSAHVQSQQCPSTHHQ
jgi:hypothetical protein